MARRAGAITAWAIAAGLGALTLGTAAVVMAQGGGGLDPADWSAVRFTILQALLSALISCLLAIPLARALFRRRFPGHGLLISMLGAPFLLPTIVAVLGLLAIFGRSGWANSLLAPLGIKLQIYGLQGVILAHVFLNLPLATRMILQGWHALPSERLRLAASLNFPARAFWQHIEAPMLRTTLPGAALAIFTICLSSFAVALTLGGGPAATTVELAIYQALRFEFALPRAATLAMLQFALCSVAVLAAMVVTTPDPFGAGMDRRIPLAQATGWRLWADTVLIALATAFVALPLCAVAFRGALEIGSLPSPVWSAAARSLALALASGTLATAAALVLAVASAQGQRRIDFAVMLPLAASPLVMGTGLFLLLYPIINPTSAALPVTLLVNATLATPFAFRILLPEARAIQTQWAPLATSLALQGWPWLRHIVLPRLRRPLGFAMGVTSALAMGDLGVIALFSSESNATLPLMVQRLMGSYRMDQAAGTALLLVVLSFTLFRLFDAGGRHDPDA